MNTGPEELRGLYRFKGVVCSIVLAGHCHAHATPYE